MPSKTSFSMEIARMRRFSVWRYRELLPIDDGVTPVTLNEGGTPLIPLMRCRSGTERVVDVYVKFEGSNPTGSFKDRGMTVGVTIARNIGVEGVIVASTGNTAASAAAYAARAGLRCVVVLPKGGVAKGKIAQALLHGAEIREVEGAFDDALDDVFTEVVVNGGRKLYPLNSYNPWRLEGQKTIAFEIVDELGFVPDIVIVPVGNAGNISAIWKGFKELYSYGLIDKLPRMVGVQAAGAAPLALTWEQGADRLHAVENPQTIASAIRIGKPVNWLKALRAVKESGGRFITVSDEEILVAMKMLAALEGIGVEPASAASLAGYRKLVDSNLIDGGEVVVLIATGHALKDPDTIVSKVAARALQLG
ncbi:MAG: threonine synthase [Ignisphaera sp.]|nr:threonine synthase [Ignisphaera sp.]MDW8086191.1 threonine synthase [Ignisphaera sp.]